MAEMLKELNYKDIKVGEKYFCDEKYHWCGNVTVIADECGENPEKHHSPDWVGFKIRIDESFGGLTGGLPVGHELSVGHDSKYAHYGSVKFRPLGSMPEYLGFTGEKDWSIVRRKETVKALMEETGQGMLDCKKALELAEWDYSKAVKELEERAKFKNLTSLVTKRPNGGM